MKKTPYSIAEVNSRLISTETVSLWNSDEGPVYWYAANVPGPFYVNTERLIGREAAGKLLGTLSSIVQMAASMSEKAALLRDAVLAEYLSNSDYQRVVANLRAVIAEQEISGKFVISGGERRDWFFSVPLAYEARVPHVFLFKDGGIYVDTPIVDVNSKVTEVIHVADLIHNAASYTDLWIPSLRNHGISIKSTVAFISRGTAGLEILERQGISARVVATIQENFFDRLCSQGLIGEEKLSELQLYYASQTEWARKYIVSNPEVLQASQLDQKSRARLQAFLRDDPWGLAMGDGSKVPFPL